MSKKIFRTTLALMAFVCSIGVCQASKKGITKIVSSRTDGCKDPKKTFECTYACTDQKCPNENNRLIDGPNSCPPTVEFPPDIIVCDVYVKQ